MLQKKKMDQFLKTHPLQRVMAHNFGSKKIFGSICTQAKVHVVMQLLLDLENQLKDIKTGEFIKLDIFLKWSKDNWINAIVYSSFFVSSGKLRAKQEKMEGNKLVTELSEMQNGSNLHSVWIENLQIFRIINLIVHVQFHSISHFIQWLVPTK